MTSPDQHATTVERHPIFSFADGEMGPLANWFIRSLERFTGQPKIKKLYLDYVDDERPPELFWQDALGRLGIEIQLESEGNIQIPETGPVLIIANHPFGVVDGLTLCALVSQVRQDYKIITHRVLRQAPAVMDKILPIDFDETEEALRTNLETRRDAVKMLDNRGVVVIFPSGAISVAKKVVGQAQDPEWKKFTAKLATRKGVTVLPFFFKGKNSSLYQMARRVSVTLGYSLMFREICKKMYKPVSVIMRKPVTPEMISAIDDKDALTQYLRDAVYGSQPPADFEDDTIA